MNRFTGVGFLLRNVERVLTSPYRTLPIIETKEREGSTPTLIMAPLQQYLRSYERAARMVMVYRQLVRNWSLPDALAIIDIEPDRFIYAPRTQAVEPTALPLIASHLYA